MNEPDPEAQQRVATMIGEHGEAAQFASIQARTLELVDQAFDFVTIIPAHGASVMGPEQPMISST